MKREKPMPWRVFVGSLLVMLSLFVGFAFNYTILGQPFRTETWKPPFGKEALQPAATLVAISLLALGLVLVFSGLKKMEPL